MATPQTKLGVSRAKTQRRKEKNDSELGVLGESKPSFLRALCTTILENFRGLRKFFIELKYSNRGIDSRQGAKHAK